MSEHSWTLGIDEAGLGPRLGPLVVALVRVRGREGALGRARRRGGAAFPRIDDSKKICRGPRGLARLEVTALASLTVARGAMPTSSTALFGSLGAERETPWYTLEIPLPVAASVEDVDRAAERLRSNLEKSSGALDAVGVRVLSSAHFNQRVADLGNKSLVQRVLLEELLEDHVPAAGEVRIGVDHLGGRRRYGDWLATLHPFVPLDVLEESRERSAYALTRARRSLAYEFLVRGDSLRAEIALASCVAKYHREVAMELFNRFWIARQENVPPTRGYEVDARRFLADLAGDRLFAQLEPAMVRRL